VQFTLPLFGAERAEPGVLQVGRRTVPLQFVRQRRARRYILRLTEEGTARVTIPRGGSPAEARAFAGRQVAWLERQLDRRARQNTPPRLWMAGTEVLFRGEPARLELSADGRSVHFAGQVIARADHRVDLRPAVERHLRRLAEFELVARTLALASAHQAQVRRVFVRNQRSRWGSCSVRGTISLNWRLIQAPDWVRDYLILHELAHLREMNHSPRFWEFVAALCPDYEKAERWLNQHARWLR
jgi:predicted metal-dependent hydrolase